MKFVLVQVKPTGKYHRLVVSRGGLHFGCNEWSGYTVDQKWNGQVEFEAHREVGARLIGEAKGLPLCSKCHPAWGRPSPQDAEDLAKATGGWMPETYFEVVPTVTVGEVEKLGIHMGMSTDEMWQAYLAWRRA